MRTTLAWLVVLTCLGSVAPAAAQDSAASEALFNKGVAAMKAGDFETACPALEESQRLDPHAGTLFALAECEAKWGKLASSVAHYSDYVGMVSNMSGQGRARHHTRVQVAKSQLEKLRGRVPQLSIVLSADAPKNTIVKRDGVLLEGVSLGMALPVDPGEHVLVTQVPGGPKRTELVSIEEGQTKEVELQVELPAPKASKPALGLSASSSGATDTGSASNSRTWGYIAGGIGLAGVATGAVTGLMSMNKKQTVDENCEGSFCNQEGLSAADDGKLLGNISTVGFGVGLVGLTTGTILLLSSPSAEPSESGKVKWQPTAIAGSRGGFAGIQGSW